EADAVPRNIEPGEIDALATELGADVGAEGFEALGHHARHIDFEQKVGAALQVKAEIDRRARQPARHGCPDALGQEIRQCEKEPQDQQGHHDDLLPAGDVNHRVTYSPFVRTSVSVLLSTRTCTLSAISTTTSPSSL